MKKCIKCNYEKLPIDFSSDASQRGGLYPRCKKCVQSEQREYNATPKGALYNRWRQIMSRCYNPAHRSYADYGGRGIVTCERWRTKDNFVNDILSILGPPPKNMSLDRMDNNSSYCPGNVRWATRSEQNINQRMKRSNSSGVLGVSLRSGRFIAEACRNGKKFRGSFLTLEKAIFARESFIAKSR